MDITFSVKIHIGMPKQAYFHVYLLLQHSVPLHKYYCQQAEVALKYETSHELYRFCVSVGFTFGDNWIFTVKVILAVETIGREIESE